MDATTFMQLQEAAQNQIDALNAQIDDLNKTKGDLVNINNIALTNTKAQCNQLLADANEQVSKIISKAKQDAQAITDLASQSKSEIDSYIENQNTLLDNRNDDLENRENALAFGQSELNKNSKDFMELKKSTISKLNDQIKSIGSFLDKLAVDVAGI